MQPFGVQNDAPTNWATGQGSLEKFKATKPWVCLSFIPDLPENGADHRHIFTNMALCWVLQAARYHETYDSWPYLHIDVHVPQIQAPHTLQGQAVATRGSPWPKPYINASPFLPGEPQPCHSPHTFSLLPTNSTPSISPLPLRQDPFCVPMAQLYQEQEGQLFSMNLVRKSQPSTLTPLESWKTGPHHVPTTSFYTC